MLMIDTPERKREAALRPRAAGIKIRNCLRRRESHLFTAAKLAFRHVDSRDVDIFSGISCLVHAKRQELEFRLARMSINLCI